MNPSRPFILRPVATILFMVAILLSGLVAWRMLPVAALPEVDYPTIQVVTYYPGASPEVVTSTITAPLERQFGQMPGLEQMSSSSSNGVSVVTLQFSLSLTLDVAEQEVRQPSTEQRILLPSDLPNPPIYNKVNPADTPILTIAVTSPTLPMTKLEDLADTRLAQKLSQVPGVGPCLHQRRTASCRTHTGQLESTRRQRPDAGKRPYCCRRCQRQSGKRQLRRPLQASTIDGNDQLKTATEFANIIIAYRDGAPCACPTWRPFSTVRKTRALPHGQAIPPPSS